VDALTFGLQLTNHSVAASAANGFDPADARRGQRCGISRRGSSLSINEWQASAPPGQSDWIELHNTAAQPVALARVLLVEHFRRPPHHIPLLRPVVWIRATVR